MTDEMKVCMYIYIQFSSIINLLPVCWSCSSPADRFNIIDSDILMMWQNTSKVCDIVLVLLWHANYNIIPYTHKHRSGKNLVGALDLHVLSCVVQHKRKQERIKAASANRSVASKPRIKYRCARSPLAAGCG